MTQGSSTISVRDTEFSFANGARTQKPRFLRAHDLAEGPNSAKSAVRQLFAHLKRGGKAKPLSAKASIDLPFLSLQHVLRSV
jgi:hypothetical protein